LAGFKSKVVKARSANKETRKANKEMHIQYIQPDKQANSNLVIWSRPG